MPPACGQCPVLEDTSPQGVLEWGGGERSRGSLDFTSQSLGLLPDCHLEVTPAGPDSPPPLLLFPWGQMSFLQIRLGCPDEKKAGLA
jgi:hypothetical protein